jgi:hypothetical protein
MYSLLKPDFVYDDVSGDITETDVDVVSDLWTMDGRNVYRGSRDPRYTHANVYWLYDEDLQRVGCSEHSLTDHGDFRLLWFQESEFGTLLQEDGWTPSGDIWGLLPKQSFERFLNEGWTSPEAILEQCLYDRRRIVTPAMIVNRPQVYSCSRCGRRALTPMKNCLSVAEPLSFTARELVLFVDSDLVIHHPPPNSSVWSRLEPRAPSSQSPSQQPEQEQAQEQTPQSEGSPQTPPPDADERSPPH